MSDANRSLVLSLMGLLMSSSVVALGAETETEREPEQSASVAAPATSAISGLVADEEGQPLKGALVSIFGKGVDAGALTATTDEEGRFEVDSVPPGLYQLRAYLDGFMPSAFAKVLVEEGMKARTILMSLVSLAEETAEAVVAETDEERTVAELKWILQHGRRNILRDDERWVPVETVADNKAFASFEPTFAVSGEFGVRESNFEQGLDEFPGAGAGLDARLAYARLFIPTRNDGRWLVSAQLLESALSSWAGRAEYTGTFADHFLTGGVSYGNYVYGDLDGYRPPEAALARRPEASSTEWFGSAYASDSFLLGSTAIKAGLAFQYFDYLQTPGYWAPSIAVTQPLGNDRTVLRGAVDYQIQAPGGEDIGLLSQVAFTDVYGRSPGSHRQVRAEKTTRVQLGVEQQVSERTRLALKVFQERADDQLVKRYSRGEPAWGGGHFRVSNHGDFVTQGVGVSVFQSLGAVQGTLGYTFGKIEKLGGLPVLPSAEPVTGLLSDEDIHDITTTIATSIDRTRTRLNAVYRLVAHPDLDGRLTGTGGGRDIDTRFSVQVYQLLPFVGWNGTRWEVMVAVRNLFYEDLESASILDELAVIDAPRRVLGGVTVRF